MKILVLDNYDSFVYNIVHIIRELGYGEHMDVIRNNKISLEEVKAYDKILLSPGPGIPSEAGIMLDLIKEYAPKKSIFGVCLGHQAIGEVFGASLINLDEVYHGIGINTKITANDTIFKGLPQTFKSGRYHSWAVDPKSNLENLTITAQDDLNNIMALKHKSYDVRGVQFHPESILTENGKLILKNWLEN
ncbi:aminodeoxychorismate/anthranilate synthase component II [Cytophagaceae bacterium ABcell3]|nr:aminodeoxychorismate/anthranilate synthase component II [Cytophagaceae bacterium ABcell3]